MITRAANRAGLLEGPRMEDPIAAVVFDEALLASANAGDSGPVLRLWTNAWCVVLGKNNRDEQWINKKALDADGVPYFHRDSGGGTVVHHPANLIYSFIAPSGSVRQLSVKDIQPFFIAVIIRALAHLDISASHTGVSDISVDGRKVSGNAARAKKNAVLFHGTLLLASELERMERYLPTPPNRPGIVHRDFVSGLWELGYPVGIKRAAQSIARAASEALGWSFDAPLKKDADLPI